MRYKKLVSETPMSFYVRQTWEADFWVRQDTAFTPPWVDKFDNGGTKVRKRYTKFVGLPEAQ
jgi:hypothetical protein